MKLYDLNLKDDEDVNYDEFIESNKEFMEEFCTLSFHNPNEKIICFKYKNRYFKTDFDYENTNEWYKCEVCLQDCRKIFPFCLLEFLCGPTNHLTLKEVEEYEIVFMEDYYENL